MKMLKKLAALILAATMALVLFTACSGDGGSTGTIDHEFHIFGFFALNFKRIDESCARDDGCAVLVVVHHRNVAFLFQATFDFKTFRCFDVLKVDAAESGGNRLNGSDKLFGVFFVELNVEAVESCENLKQQRLAFHHRFASQRTDVAQSEHGGAV